MTLCVQIRGSETTIRILADSAQEDAPSGELLAKRAGQIIGHFKLTDIVGWWLEE